MAWQSALGRAARSTPEHLGAPHDGDPELRQHLAALIDREPDEVVVTTGVRVTVRGLAADAKITLVERPTFSGVPLSLTQHNLAWRYSSWQEMSDPQAPDIDCALLWITSPSRNPDGRSLTEQESDSLEKAARATNSRIVQNRSYWWCSPDTLTVPGSTVVVGLHKVAGPGARLGCASGPDIGDRLRPELRAATPPLFWQRAWAEFIAHDGLTSLVDHARTTNHIARTRFLDALNGIADAEGSSGPSLLLSLGFDSQTAVAALAERSVLVSPGSDFAGPPDSIRVSFSGVRPDQAVTAAHHIRHIRK